MNSVESNYQKYLTFLSNDEYLIAILWARIILGDICEEVYTDNDRKILPKDNTDGRLREITKNDWIPSLVLLELRVIQNRSNYALHVSADDRQNINQEYCKDPSKSLRIIMNWYRKKNNIDEDNVIYHPNDKRLKPTFSNPRYYQDIKEFSSSRYTIDSLPSNRTILIVIGTGLNAELLERPLAEQLRDEIERKFPYRAFIVNDFYYMSLDKLSNFPVISIGNTIDNRATLQITSYGKTKESNYLYEAITQFGGGYKIALWGKTNSKTKAKVKNFIKNKNGLSSFFDRFLGDVN